MEEAQKELGEALQIRRELAQKNPETYLPDVATTLSNLAVLDRIQSRLDEARMAFDEALRIYQDFAKQDCSAPHFFVGLASILFRRKRGIWSRCFVGVGTDKGRKLWHIGLSRTVAT